MGKKMGINTKAVEARERKEALSKAKKESIERRREDEYWKDDDKNISRKMDRQREREIKAQEERERRAALKEAYEKDMEAAENSAKSKAAKNAADAPKLTRVTIQSKLEDNTKATDQLTKQMNKVNIAPTPLVPNFNRLEADGESATSVDQALRIFKQSSTKMETSKKK